MCNGTRVHRGGKRGEVVVQRGTTFLDDLLDGLVLEQVLVEQHVDDVVPARIVSFISTDLEKTHSPHMKQA